MYRIKGCVSAPLIPYMFKTVQSSDRVYILKLNWLGKGLFTVNKPGHKSRTSIFFVKRKDIFQEMCRIYGNNEPSFSFVTRLESGADSVEDVSYVRKTATSQTW